MYEIVPFNDLQECARQTLPFLTCGKIGLSGGSTYAQLFPQWAALRPQCQDASFFPVDERIVPFDDPASNWGQAYRLFLKPLGKEPDRDHFASSVHAYEQIIQDAFGQAAPIFDVIFLGVGNDGHTASLFPGSDYLDDTDTVVLQTASPQPPTNRISLAPGVLTSARKLIVIINGAQKKPVLEAIRREREELPIVKILSRRPESTLYVERSLLD